jgi:hypothetical protein
MAHLPTASTQRQAQTTLYRLQQRHAATFNAHTEVASEIKPARCQADTQRT